MESHNEDVFESVETPSSDSHVESSVESEIRSEISVFDEWTLMGLNDNAKADVKRLHRIVDKKQATIEELHKQISYLKKKTDLQREMLDTELNITQAFELSVHTLEKANKRLLNETKKQEKTIESLNAANDMLESKCDDLVKQLSAVNRQLTSLQRQHEKLAARQRTEADTAIGSAKEETSSQQRLTRPLRHWWPALNSSLYDGAGGSNESLHCRSPATTGSFLSASPNFASSSLYGDVGDEGGSLMVLNDCDGGDGVERPAAGFTYEVAATNSEHGLFVTRREHNEKQQHIVDLEYELSELIQENQALRMSQSLRKDAEFVSSARSIHEEMMIVDQPDESDNDDDNEDADDQHVCTTTTRPLSTPQLLREELPQSETVDDLVVPVVQRPAAPLQPSAVFDDDMIAPAVVQRPAAPPMQLQQRPLANMAGALSVDNNVRSLVHLYESMLFVPEPVTMMMTVPRTRSLLHIPPLVTVTDEDDPSSSPAKSAADLMEPNNDNHNHNEPPIGNRRLTRSCNSLVSGGGEEKRRSFMQEGAFSSAVAALKAAGFQMTGPDEDARRSAMIWQ